MKKLYFPLLALMFISASCIHGMAAHASSEAGVAVMPIPHEKKVRMIFAGKEAVLALDDNPASRDFLEMLPLRLEFEDYNRTEKIAVLPRKLLINGAPSNCKPAAGSFAYYAPWGNLAIFYRDFRQSNGLVPLGNIESGLDELTKIQDGTIIRLEKMD